MCRPTPHNCMFFVFKKPRKTQKTHWSTRENVDPIRADHHNSERHAWKIAVKRLLVCVCMCVYVCVTFSECFSKKVSRKRPGTCTGETDSCTYVRYCYYCRDCTAILLLVWPSETAAINKYKGSYGGRHVVWRDGEFILFTYVLVVQFCDCLGFFWYWSAQQTSHFGYCTLLKYTYSHTYFRLLLNEWTATLMSHDRTSLIVHNQVWSQRG